MVCMGIVIKRMFFCESMLVLRLERYVWFLFIVVCSLVLSEMGGSGVV